MIKLLVSAAGQVYGTAGPMDQTDTTDMTTPRLIIYDDNRGRFGPLAHLRSAFELRTGAWSNLQRIEAGLGSKAELLFSPQRLEGVLSQRYPSRKINPKSISGGPWLMINGRWFADSYVTDICELKPGQAITQHDGQVVAACLDDNDAQAFLTSGFESTPDTTQATPVNDRVLMERPWHILAGLSERLTFELQGSDTSLFNIDEHPGVTVAGDHPVRIAEDATLLAPIAIDATNGPVVIQSNALVNPFVVLQGPCFIGAQSVIASHGNIRSGTAVGDRCKIGGEVSMSLIGSFTNKAHVGYLGHSLVGSWSNLGAGTTVSNLKNTYGNVRVQLDAAAAPEDSGQMFHGVILGEHVRTAIGTRIPTGSVIHTGCMLASSGWAPKFARALGFYTDQGRQPYDIEKLIATVRTVKSRRGVTLEPAEEALIRSLGMS